MNRRERRAAGKSSKVERSKTERSRTEQSRTEQSRTEQRRADQDSQAAPTVAALYETGIAHLRAGRHLDAQICCQQALAIDAGHADTLHLMGLLSLQAGQYDHAVEWLSRAIRQTPNTQTRKTEYLSALGITLKQMGRLDDARNVFDKAVQLKPDDAELWKHAGGVLVALNRP